MLGTLNDAEIEALLHSEVIGRIGCHDGGRTYVVPITYAYDGEAVYAHSAEGLKLTMMRNNPEVCFEVEHMDDLASWRSVIAWGRFEQLAGDEAQRGMQRLLERLRPLMVSATARPSHGLGAQHRADVQGHTPAVYRIRLRERTGRFERR
ncbi:MAG: pyridoxamine 5'-phosphate oxidase family protein [Myxococcales bacterium]|nr:pyridoxamine 5'-phosphate oxidase family protein [Myxococcales bacterium]